MLVRIATESDYDFVLQLMHYLHPDDPCISTDVTHTIYKEILNSSCFFIAVAEIEKKVVGSYYINICLLYTSPSPRDLSTSRMPSSA